MDGLEKVKTDVVTVVREEELFKFSIDLSCDTGECTTFFSL